MSSNLFWLVLWSILGIVLIGFATIVNNNDNNDNKKEIVLQEMQNKHNQMMAEKGYIQKRVVTCIKEDCRSDIVWRLADTQQ